MGHRLRVNVLDIMCAGSCNGVAIPIVPYCLIFGGMKQGRVTFDRSLEVVNWIVWLGGHGW